MASGTRTLWKGAITFGLVHIPVGLHTAATESGVDFDWLDKRSMDPVGYKRINKRTGKEIDRDNIVKGVEYEDGKYVIISPEEIEKVYPRTTQTIEIVQFVDAGEIPFVYLERPYYLEPINKGQKVYALLRDVLQKTGKIGVAKVVIATKQHLAAVVPAGRALVLNLMRWGDEVRPLEGLDLPPESTKASTAETKMAVQLVKEMTAPWKPTEFEDEFKHKVMELVQKKVKAGETETVIEPEEEAPGEGAEVIDLSELLKRSLKGGGSSRKTSAAKTTSAAKATKKSPAAKKSAPKKHAATARKAA